MIDSPLLFCDLFTESEKEQSIVLTKRKGWGYSYGDYRVYE